MRRSRGLGDVYKRQPLLRVNLSQVYELALIPKGIHPLTPETLKSIEQNKALRLLSSQTALSTLLSLTTVGQQRLITFTP
jgi:hypothetical protein